MLIRTPAGGVVTLSQVARLLSVEGPEVIEHEGGQRYVVVKSKCGGVTSAASWPTSTGRSRVG